MAKETFKVLAKDFMRNNADTGWWYHPGYNQSEVQVTGTGAKTTLTVTVDTEDVSKYLTASGDMNKSFLLVYKDGTAMADKIALAKGLK